MRNTSFGKFPHIFFGKHGTIWYDGSCIRYLTKGDLRPCICVRIEYDLITICELVHVLHISDYLTLTQKGRDTYR